MTSFKAIQAFVRIRDDVWHSLQPRTYTGAAGFGTPDIPATLLGAECWAIGRDKTPYHTRTLLAWMAGKLATLRVPTFHVGRDLLTAANLTQPPESMPWTDVAFPHDAGLFLLPSGLFVTPDGRDFVWVAWCRVRDGDAVKIPGYWQHPPFPLRSTDGSDMLVFATGAPTRDGNHDGCLVKNYSAAMWPSVVVPKTEVSHHRDESISCAEGEIINRLSMVALNVMIAMSCRPELLERDGRRVRVMKKGPAREEWTPNWVGRNYRIQRADGDGTHASPRMHWRRGHHRRQPCGTGRKEHRIIWLEPVLVGGS